MPELNCVATSAGDSQVFKSTLSSKLCPVVVESTMTSGAELEAAIMPLIVDS